MTNKEFCKETLLEIAMIGDGFAVKKEDGTPVCCNDLFCYECVFAYGCQLGKRKEWLNSEYVDPNRIDVGDIVTVVDNLKTHSCYSKWSGLGEYRRNFVNGSTPDDGLNCTVLAIGKHDKFENITLALIQNPNTTQVFIINVKGIKKVKL